MFTYQLIKILIVYLIGGDEVEQQLLIKTIKNIKKGKRNAFKLIIDQYGKKLFGYIYSLTSDKSLTEDIYQEVLIKIFTQIHVYDHKSPFENWIIVIARNYTYDQVKKKQVLVFPFKETFDSMCDHSANPENIIIQKEHLKQLDEHISKLSKHHQEVIQLKYFGDYSYKEMASIMNVEEKKIKWLLYDARQSLAAVYRKEAEHVV